MAETVATPLAKLIVNTARQVVADPLQVCMYSSSCVRRACVVMNEWIEVGSHVGMWGYRLTLVGCAARSFCARRACEVVSRSKSEVMSACGDIGLPSQAVSVRRVCGYCYEQVEVGGVSVCAGATSF